jgi:tetratricopeptide (TPR) repeat protein
MRLSLFLIFYFQFFFSLNAQVLVPANSVSQNEAKSPESKQSVQTKDNLTENDPKLSEAIKTCLDKKDLASCMVAVPRLNAEEKFALAFKTGEILCELDASHCFGVYYTALKLDPKKAEDFFNKLIAECEKNADYCDAVASLHEVKKNYEQALLTAKKYFTKHKKGMYILLAFKYGNKQDAYDASLADCKADEANCVFYLRYFYEHPQKDEILKLAVKSCNEQKTPVDGASNCAILGTYYFKIQEFDLAYKYWAKDCDTNNLSCVLILGAKRYSDEVNKATLKKFCSVKTGLINSLNLQLTECEKITDETVLVPPAIEKYAIETLKSFMSEQKLKN